MAALTASPSSAMARIAPKNGATEKYAPVRAVPSSRNPTTNNARLAP